MLLHLRALANRLRSSYWFVPSVLAIVAILLAFGMVEVDRILAQERYSDLKLPWAYTGGPEGARGVLSAIASSVITVAGTTFSITIASLSLASSQFGPRLLRNFMRDRGNQMVLGTFTATFVYCLLVLRTVRGTDETTYVPHLSVTLGIVLALLDVAVLIYFIHHAAESIQVSHLIDRVGEDLDESVRRLFPEELGEPDRPSPLPSSPPFPLLAKGGGYVEEIDEDALLDIAQRHDLVIRIDARPGDYVIPGTSILTVWPEPTEDADGEMQGTYAYARQRSSQQDVTFAFQQLTEIAVRALSPGINDPFTAIACVDRASTALFLLGERQLPSAYRYDEDDSLRVIARPYSYREVIQAAFGPIEEYGKDQPLVRRHIVERVRLLQAYAIAPDYRQALTEARERLLT